MEVVSYQLASFEAVPPPQHSVLDAKDSSNMVTLKEKLSKSVTSCVESSNSFHALFVVLRQEIVDESPIQMRNGKIQMRESLK